MEKSLAHRYLETLSIRRLLNDSERRYLERLERGYQGEMRFSNYLNQVLNNKFRVLSNLYLQHSRKIQIDFLIICDKVVYLFEVKNYHFNLNFDGTNWQMSSGKTMLENPLIQLFRASQVVEQIIADFDRRIVVKPFLVFINPDQTVNISSDQTMHIIRSFEIKAFLENILIENYANPNLNKLVSHFEKYVYPENPFPFGVDKSTAPIEKGVYCPNCQSFHLQFKNMNAHCPCGAKHKIKDLVAQTIQDYCILNPDKHCSVKDISDFVNQEVSQITIRKVMNKQLNIIQKQPIRYKNPYLIEDKSST